MPAGAVLVEFDAGVVLVEFGGATKLAVASAAGALAGGAPGVPARAPRPSLAVQARSVQPARR